MRKRKIIKIAAVVFATTALAATSYATFLLYPHPFFEHETKFGPIGVLSQQPLDAEFSRAVEDAIAIISESDLYDPQAEMGVLLAKDHVYHRLSPGKALAYALGPYVILAGDTDASANRLSWNKSPVKMNLVGAIAHELTHCMQGRYHGHFSMRRAMMPWKREGYAEYVAHSKARMHDGYSLVDSLDRLLTPEKAQPVDGWMTAEDGFDYPITYYRFRLMTEFLFEVEGISYDQFVEQAEFHDVYNRMLAWHKQRVAQGG